MANSPLWQVRRATKKASLAGKGSALAPQVPVVKGEKVYRPARNPCILYKSNDTSAFHPVFLCHENARRKEENYRGRM